MRLGTKSDVLHLRSIFGDLTIYQLWEIFTVMGAHTTILGISNIDIKWIIFSLNRPSWRFWLFLKRKLPFGEIKTAIISWVIIWQVSSHSPLFLEGVGDLPLKPASGKSCLTSYKRFEVDSCSSVSGRAPVSPTSIPVGMDIVRSLCSLCNQTLNVTLGIRWEQLIKKSHSVQFPLLLGYRKTGQLKATDHYL